MTKNEIKITTNPPAIGWLIGLGILFIPFHLMLNAFGGWRAPWWVAFLPLSLFLVGLGAIFAYAIWDARRTNQRWSVAIKVWRFERHWGWKDGEER